MKDSWDVQVLRGPVAFISNFFSFFLCEEFVFPLIVYFSQCNDIFDLKFLIDGMHYV